MFAAEGCQKGARRGGGEECVRDVQSNLRYFLLLLFRCEAKRGEATRRVSRGFSHRAQQQSGVCCGSVIDIKGFPGRILVCLFVYADESSVNG